MPKGPRLFYPFTEPFPGIFVRNPFFLPDLLLSVLEFCVDIEGVDDIIDRGFWRQIINYIYCNIFYGHVPSLFYPSWNFLRSNLSQHFSTSSNFSQPTRGSPPSTP